MYANNTSLGNGSNYHCDLPPYLPPSLGISNAVNIVQAVIAIIAMLIGLLINIYLLIVIIKFPSLHQRSLYLSLQIIIIEIVYHLIIPPTILVSSITGTWVFGEFMCNITGMVHDAFAMFRFSMMLVLTIDRFISIFKPFFYNAYGGHIAWSLSIVMWILTLIRVIIPVYGVLDCYNYIPTFKTCTVFSGCSRECEIFTATSISFIVFTGVILSSCLYGIIFIRVRKICKHHSSIVVQTDHINKEGRVVIDVERANAGIMKEKVIIIMFLLLISLIGGTAPAIVLYIISLFFRKPDYVTFIINMVIGRTFFNFIPVFDSITFVRYRDVRQVSSKLFHLLTKNIKG